MHSYRHPIINVYKDLDRLDIQNCLESELFTGDTSEWPSLNVAFDPLGTS